MQFGDAYKLFNSRIVYGGNDGIPTNIKKILNNFKETLNQMKSSIETCCTDQDLNTHSNMSTMYGWYCQALSELLNNKLTQYFTKIEKEIIDAIKTGNEFFQGLTDNISAKEYRNLFDNVTEQDRNFKMDMDRIIKKLNTDQQLNEEEKQTKDNIDLSIKWLEVGNYTIRNTVIPFLKQKLTDLQPFTIDTNIEQ